MAHGRRAGVSGASAAGSQTSKIAPVPNSLCTRTSPLCVCAAHCAMASPSPLQSRAAFASEELWIYSRRARLGAGV